MHTLYRFRYSHTVINRFKFPAQQSDRLGYENTAIAARRATGAATLDQCLQAMLQGTERVPSMRRHQ